MTVLKDSTCLSTFTIQDIQNVKCSTCPPHHDHDVLFLQICRNCSGCAERLVSCVSLDCPVLYKLSRVNRQLSKAPYLRQLLEQF